MTYDAHPLGAALAGGHDPATCEDDHPLHHRLAAKIGQARRRAHTRWRRDAAVVTTSTLARNVALGGDVQTLKLILHGQVRNAVAENFPPGWALDDARLAVRNLIRVARHQPHVEPSWEEIVETEVLSDPGDDRLTIRTTVRRRDRA